VNDSWNEGVTEYVDSVLLLHDADKSLENGLGTVDIPVPLAKMPIPWNLDDATYWRGCYVMKMLESEIGLDAVLEALKLITTERVGQDTRWTDLRAYFERTSHRALDWFWRQWIEGAAFPTLHYTAETSRDAKGQFETVIKVDQEGISTPFQIRAAVKLAGAEDTHDRPIQLTDRSSTLRFTTTRNPNHVELVIFPYTLARLKRS
jgi:aminopeptidase N